jgi:tRNA modification GTPase
MGIERAMNRSQGADLRVFLMSEEQEVLSVSALPHDICVVGKADIFPGDGFRVSGLTGIGLDRLLLEVQNRLQGLASRAGTLTRQRHVMSVRRAKEALESAQMELEGNARLEVGAEEIRSALRALDSLVGRVDVENVLDEIFSSFCIGK